MTAAHVGSPPAPGRPAAGPDPVPGGLAELVAAYTARRPGWQPVERGQVRVVEVEPLVRGRPGVLDVVAVAGGRPVHVVIGLRPPGDEARFLPGAKDPVLGLFEDADGLAVAIDAVSDEATATALLEVAAGLPAGTRWARALDPTSWSVGVAFDDRVTLTVLDAPTDEAQEWVKLLQALDTAGFAHLPPAVAIWRRSGRVLGLVREVLPAVTSGWTAAQCSLRELLRTGSAPEDAPGDFAADATALGVMTGRLHVALDRAFGRWPGDVVTWSGSVAAAVRFGAPRLSERGDVRQVLDDLAMLPTPCSAIRTHGDLQLARVGKSGDDWYLVGGAEPAGALPIGEPAGVRRSALADVADMLWSLGRAAAEAVAECEQDDDGPTGAAEAPTGDTEGTARSGPADDHGAGRRGGDDGRAGGAGAEARRLADAWERRNRRAFVAGYLRVPGVTALVPADRRALRTLTSAFELERSVRRPATGGHTTS